MPTTQWFSGSSHIRCPCVGPCRRKQQDGRISERGRRILSITVREPEPELEGEQQGLLPPVHSFNKSDLSDLGKRFNDCFLRERGWVVWRDWAGTVLWCTALQMDAAAEQQTLYFSPSRESTRLGLVVCFVRPALNCLFSDGG